MASNLNDEDLLNGESDFSSDDENSHSEISAKTTWKDLGIVDVLCTACEQLKWEAPTLIQRKAIPLALEGKDVIGLAETGSGKTAAFTLPVLQALLEHPQRYFALILTPTRELADQIAEQINSLGVSIRVSTVVLVGGISKAVQAAQLARKPHVIIATPGRLLDHLETTKGFNLRAIKYLVLDEADRMLNMDFEVEMNKILKVIPRDRRTMLFSATMTSKVNKLQRASLRDPVRVEVSGKFQTVETLQQYHLFIPYKYYDVYLAYLLTQMAGKSVMVFCWTRDYAVRLALLLRNLGFSAIPLHGKMSQNRRMAALNKFKAKDRSILISTDVASRGLDIPHVDVVINFGTPINKKDYIHRVGRTARAGRSGLAITLVCQYDILLYLRVEQLLGKKLELYETVKNDVMVMQERVVEAQGIAAKELAEIKEKETRRKRGAGEGIDEMGGFSDKAKRFKYINKRKK